MKIFNSKIIFFFSVVVFLGLSLWIYKNINFSKVLRVGDTSEIISVDENFEIKVTNGNIVKVSESKKEIILINKKDYEGISKFIKVWVSPDDDRLCFLGQYIVPMWLFVSDSDGSNVVKVDSAKNCSFSPDSTKISYNNHTTDVSPVDVRIYNLESSEKLNLTRHLSSDEIYRAYNSPEWINDVLIESEYEEINFNDFMNKTLGISEINVETGEITDR